MTETTRDNCVILDDGVYFVDLNCNYPQERAPGFLQRRCDYGFTTPGGFECVGGFEQAVDGRWRADVSAPYDEESDSDIQQLGTFDQRMDAIVALWAHRHEAFHRKR